MVPFRVEREVTVRSVLVCVRTELAEQAVSNAAAQLGLSDIITTAVSGADAVARGAVDAGARGLIRGGEREDLVATVAKALMLLMRGRMVPGQPVPLQRS